MASWNEYLRADGPDYDLMAVEGGWAIYIVQNGEYPIDDRVFTTLTDAELAIEELLGD